MPLERTDVLFTPGVSLETPDIVIGTVDQTTGADEDLHPLLWGGSFLTWGGSDFVLVW